MKKIKRDDEVIVTTGKDKDKRGKVLKVLDDGRVLVSGINMMKKHTKPNPMLGTPGGPGGSYRTRCQGVIRPENNHDSDSNNA